MLGHESDIRKYPNMGYMGTLWLALRIQSVVNKGKGGGQGLPLPYLTELVRAQVVFVLS